MIKKLRRALKDGAAYALGISEKQIADSSDKLLGQDPANHILHGFFDPIFKRNVEILIRHKAQQALIDLIDGIIRKIRLDSDLIYRRICFNLTVHSISLLHSSMKSKHLAGDLLSSYLEREWAYYNDTVGLGNNKVLVNNYVILLSEKEFFAGKIRAWDSDLEGLYMTVARMGAIAVEMRQSSYQTFSAQPFGEHELFQLWQCIFGLEFDALYRELRNDFSVIHQSFYNSTMDIMFSNRKDENSAEPKEPETHHRKEEHSIVLICPTCMTKMRISIPINNSRGSCGKCKSIFILKGNHEGDIWAEQVGPSSMELSAALSLLGLTDEATSKDIKSAYRKKISEYHPDKVQSLGEKIKKTALEETQKLNIALELLKRNGML